jgi:hypothetical protein
MACTSSRCYPDRPCQSTWDTFAQCRDEDARHYMPERAALELAIVQVTRERAREARSTMLKSRNSVQVLEREQAKQVDPAAVSS